MLKLAPILKEISKDFRMGGHDGSGGHDGKLHQAFTLVMEWEAVEYLKVSRWDQKSQITTVEFFEFLWRWVFLDEMTYCRPCDAVFEKGFQFRKCEGKNLMQLRFPARDLFCQFQQVAAHQADY